LEAVALGFWDKSLQAAHEALRTLYPDELYLLLAGPKQVDPDCLCNCLKFKGFKSDPTPDHFRTALRRLDNTERRKFVMFATGTDGLLCRSELATSPCSLSSGPRPERFRCQWHTRAPRRSTSARMSRRKTLFENLRKAIIVTGFGFV